MMDPEVLTPIIAGRWLEGFDHRRIMASIRCPTLLVQADEKNGGALTNDDVEMARQLIEDCVIVKLGGVGHQIHWNAAERLVAPALAFVESLK
jgi:pimeloyl-ACP methyl ester carboxylesterase